MYFFFFFFLFFLWLCMKCVPTMYILLMWRGVQFWLGLVARPESLSTVCMAGGGGDVSIHPTHTPMMAQMGQSWRLSVQGNGAVCGRVRATGIGAGWSQQSIAHGSLLERSFRRRSRAQAIRDVGSCGEGEGGPRSMSTGRGWWRLSLSLSLAREAGDSPAGSTVDAGRGTV